MPKATPSTSDAPATDGPVVLAPVSPAPVAPAPADPVLSLTQADLDALLARAVQAGAAQAAAHFSQFVPSLGAPAVDAEKPAVWSHAEFMRKLNARIVWFNEREERAAQLALDTYYPEETDEEEA